MERARRFRPPRALVAAARVGLVVALAGPSPCAAQVGCLVGGEGGPPVTVDATRVVLAREGERTVLTVQLRAHATGPVALVLPVPASVERDQVRLLDGSVLRALEARTAPRLYDYVERDPCWSPDFPTPDPNERYEPHAVWSFTLGAPVHPDEEPERIEGDALPEEAREIAIIEASGLARWLTRRGFGVSPGLAASADALGRRGRRLLIVEQTTGDPASGTDRHVSPTVRVDYEASALTLPLGMACAGDEGDRELVVHTITRGGRVDAASHPRVPIPTHFRVDPSIRPRFEAFYEALVDATLARHPGAVITELAGELGGEGSWDTVIAPEAMAALAGPLLAPAPPPRRRSRARRAGPPRPAPWDRETDLTLTRLRYRWSDPSIDALVLESAEPIEGGYYVQARRGEGPWLVRDARPSARNRFEARYFIGHEYEEAISCGARAVRGVWVPDRSVADDVHPFEGLPERDRALAALPALRIADVVLDDVPALGLTAPSPARADEEPSTAPARPSNVPGPAPGCGCRAAGIPSPPSPTLALVMSVVLLSRRRACTQHLADR